MKRKIKIFAYLLAVVLSFFTINTAISYAYTVSKAEAVMEVVSGRMLYSFNAEVKLPMASTTKIMTAIVAIENCPLDKEVKITKESVGIEGSSIYLHEGETLTMEQLLYALLLSSANDASVAIATEVGGNLSAFVDMMNQRVTDLRNGEPIPEEVKSQIQSSINKEDDGLIEGIKFD